jgi:hypothetical protein
MEWRVHHATQERLIKGSDRLFPIALLMGKRGKAYVGPESLA